jgi:hypothetical protein
MPPSNPIDRVTPASLIATALLEHLAVASAALSGERAIAKPSRSRRTLRRPIRTLTVRMSDSTFEAAPRRGSHGSS